MVAHLFSKLSIPSLFLAQTTLSVPVPLGQPLTTLTTLPSLSLPPIGHDASRLLGGRLPLATMHNTPVHLSISLRILSPLPICLVLRPIIVYIPTRDAS